MAKVNEISPAVSDDDPARRSHRPNRRNKKQEPVQPEYVIGRPPDWSFSTSLR